MSKKLGTSELLNDMLNLWQKYASNEVTVLEFVGMLECVKAAILKVSAEAERDDDDCT